jgi:hypothetical protein
MLQQIDSAIAFAMVMLILSLIITALVQIVLASFDLRGLNLVWAMTRLFHEVDPAMRDPVGKKKWYELFKPTMGRRLAQAVSRYKPLTSGIVGRAKAIRSDELLKVLQKLAENPTTNLPTAVHDKLGELVNQRVPGGLEEARQASELIKNLTNVLDPSLKTQLETRITDAVHQAVGTVSKMEAGVSQWFDAVMDRSSEVFSAHSKVYTFAFSALLAFGWHIDSGLIYRQITTSSDVRDSLNRGADSVVAQGDKLLQSKHVNKAFNDLADHFQEMSKTLVSTATLKCDDGGKAWTAANSSALWPLGDDVQAAIDAACKKDKDTPDYASAFKSISDKAAATAGAWSKAPMNFERCSQGERWVQSSQADFPSGMDATGEFDKECQDAAKAAIGEAGESITSLRKTLDASKLKISTTALHYNGKDVSVAPFHLTGYQYWPHVLGTTATMLLLSLGAPFWFNTLRELSNLKPVVAQKMESESADGANGGDDSESS